MQKKEIKTVGKTMGIGKSVVILYLIIFSLVLFFFFFVHIFTAEHFGGTFINYLKL